MAMEPSEGHVTPEGDEGAHVIVWPLEKVIAGLNEAVGLEAGAHVVCVIEDDQLRVTLTPPPSEAGYDDSQIKAFIGDVETEIERRLGLKPETDKSIE